MKCSATLRAVALWLLALMSGVAAAAESPAQTESARPNVIVILADDLGLGDIRALNPDRCRFPTPWMDRLASEGMAFTDAHSVSSVCTPSRYSLLTGRYSWRTRLQKGVLYGFDGPLISPDRLTLGGLFQSQGYTSVCVGKWHVGMDLSPENDGRQPVTNGPLTRGFDRFFGISASLDMPPYAFLEGAAFTAPVDTVKELWKNRKGPAQTAFTNEKALPELTRRAVTEVRALAAADRPYFLYLPLTAPHTPIVPGEEWKGKSGLNDYGDFVMHVDSVIGEVMRAVDESGGRENTVILVTSDNGCSPSANVRGMEEKGHFASGPFRGYKSDIWEGGHRVPFLVRWPERVKAGTKNDALICQIDLLATFAEILRQPLPEDAGEDSESFLPSLLDPAASARETLIHHSIDGDFAIRQGDWKLALCPGSGGWSQPVDSAALAGGLPFVQLYNLESDPGETRNLALEHPERVAEMTAELTRHVEAGHTAPGKKGANDVPVQIQKHAAPAKAK